MPEPGAAAAELLPLVYDELRKLAAARLADEKPGQTLQPTALVHEAYVRLVGRSQQVGTGRGHFFAAAAEAMRRILVEAARRKNGPARRRRRRVDLDEVDGPPPRSRRDLLALDDALARLAAEDPQAAELVKLRFFAGLSVEEAAEPLGISRGDRRPALGLRPGLAACEMNSAAETRRPGRTVRDIPWRDPVRHFARSPSHGRPDTLPGTRHAG